MGYQLDFGALVQYLGLFLEGMGVTLGLTALASAAGVALGIAGAAAARSRHIWVRRLITGYVELIRNTPFIVQMFFIFFGLPSLGLRLSALQAAALAMIINLGAYAVEIIRAGLDSVPAGQREAGHSMGLHRLGVFWLIVLPQALASVYPALVGQITITMLESAVVSQIAVVDLTHVGDYIQSRTYRAFETYLAIALIYLCLAISLRWFLVRAGSKLHLGRPK